MVAWAGRAGVGEIGELEEFTSALLMRPATAASAPSMVLLIDHANVPLRSESMGSVIAGWLDAVQDRLPEQGVSTILGRTYGGWWVETTASEARYKATEFYEANFPSVVRHRGRYYRLRFEFADYLLLVQPRLRITHTVVVRAAAQDVSLRPSAVDCGAAGCELSSVRKWVRKRRACTRAGCLERFSEKFERREQKQVDTHIAADALRCAFPGHGVKHLAIASDDADMVPILGAVAASLTLDSVAWLRFDRKHSYLDSPLAELGVRIATIAPDGGN